MRYTIFTILLLVLVACQKEDPVEQPPFPDLVYDPTPMELVYPETFPILEIPVDNPTTLEGVRLGRHLYYDAALHADSAMACASCHVQQHSFSSPGGVLPHINLAWNNVFLWNGKIRGSLEDIMLFEVEEFFKTDLDRLQRYPEYPGLYYEAFGETEISHELTAKALSQFFRTLISANSRYDRKLDPAQLEFFTDEEHGEFSEWLDNTERPSYSVLEEDGEIIACGGIYYDSDVPAAGLAWGMVRSDRHQNGLGRRLTEYRLAQLSDQFPEVEHRLCTTQHSVGFYEKMGFAIVKITADGFGAGMDRYDMTRPAG